MDEYINDHVFSLLGIVRDNVVREIAKRVAGETNMKMLDIAYPANMITANGYRTFRYADIEFDNLLVKLEFSGSDITDIVAYYAVEINGKTYKDSTTLWYPDKPINEATNYIANSFASAIISLLKN